MNNEDHITNKQSNIVSIYLMGGLGNQLFQIFTALSYGIRHKKRVVLPYSRILTVGIHRPTYWDSLLRFLKDYTTFNESSGFSNSELIKIPCYREPYYHYSEIPPVLNNNLLLYGYFQSWKYIQNEKEQLFSLIQLKQQQESIVSEFPEYFTDAETISMHFRLGDYKEKQDYHPILPYEYYENAIFNVLLYSTMDNKNAQRRVLYFCEKDDNDIVNKHIIRLKKKYDHIDFIKVNDIIEDWKQLLIMSCCNNNIIANSSFSWWGGYFNQKPKKIVCYPNLWFGPKAKNDVSDMFPIEWNLIKW